MPNTEPSEQNQEPDLSELGYGAALSELEGILAELESSMVDVDTLATKVGRAAVLVAHCRDRLAVVRNDVADVVADLDEGNANV